MERQARKQKGREEKNVKCEEKEGDKEGNNKKIEEKEKRRNTIKILI